MQVTPAHAGDTHRGEHLTGLETGGLNNDIGLNQRAVIHHYAFGHDPRDAARHQIDIGPLRHLEPIVVDQDALAIRWIVICPLLSGPETMIVWTTKGATNAEQEAQAGRDHREAA